jgi:LmbE family N-acetylglucosaminyl deacetylase
MRPRWSTRLRGALYGAIEGLWSLGCTGLGLLWRPERHVRPWSPAGGRVLVVAPHPDDETIACGGTLVMHQRAGDAVTVLVVTDGGASGAARPSERAAEAESAAAILGGAWRMWGLPEGAWPADECRARLRAALDELQPILIYAPACVDFHPQHLQIAHVLAAVLAEWPGACRVRVYEVGVPLTPSLANCIAVLGEAAPTKERAIAAYASQQRALQPICRMQRYNRRLFRAPGAVEVFRELSGAEYVHLMARGPWLTDSDSPFRGIRGRPFDDGLAFVVGWQVRWKLRG